MTKFMLASDYDESKIRFPVIAQPKIDGVRGGNLTGKLTGRSLKCHKNRYTTAFYSHSSCIGFDGELAAAHECDPDLCRKTSSALTTIAGEPYTLWWLFDYITPETVVLPYRLRLEALTNRVRELYHINNDIWQHLRVVESVVCNNMEELLACDAKWLAMGYEGTCLRDPEGKYKQGRSTVREGGLLRIKRFVESEALVMSIEEGETNLNAAQTNELGRTFRTSHKEGKIPNGMVGNLQCKALADVFDLDFPDRKLIECGQLITVSPGKMKEDEKLMYFQNQGLIIGKTIKYKFFPKGIKDQPRFPNFQSFRIDSDL